MMIHWRMCPVRALTLGVLGVLCMLVSSCGNGSRPSSAGDVDSTGVVGTGQPVPDSLQAALDSVAAYEQLHSEETLKTQTQEALENYVETSGALAEEHFSESFRKAINEWNADTSHEYWSVLWNTGSVYTVKKCDVTQVVGVGADTAQMNFVLTLTDDEGQTSEETFTASLVLENGKWKIDNFEHNGEAAR